MKWIAALLVLAVVVLPGAGLARDKAPDKAHSAAYRSAQQKIDLLSENGARAQPQPTTTTLTMDEINAYLAEGGVALPAGVERVRFSSVPAVVTAAARIDFDQLPMSSRPRSPLIAVLLTGVHDVVVVAQATGSGGRASVRVESVAIDDIEVPRVAMQFLVDHYLKPKYGPDAGLDSHFRLPARIDTAVVGSNEVALTQK